MHEDNLRWWWEDEAYSNNELPFASQQFHPHPRLEANSGFSVKPLPVEVQKLCAYDACYQDIPVNYVLAQSLG
jgi:hypothetical protein